MSVTHSWLGRLHTRHQGSVALAGAAAADDAGALHQHRDSVVADPNPAAKNKLGVHPLGAIIAVRRDMDLADHIGQPGMPDRPRRRRPEPPRIEAGTRDAQHAAGDLDRQPLS
jgi:hypothetical protein